ncbi:MAG: CPBP family intramembrane metalloprotease, partial [Oscillospiraceae bacterium]|nr:CPBP family intramembrane metalloprotease [Oscillospiraceae bacterium]
MTATKKKWLIVAIVLVACIGMGLVDALWQPIYWVKSAVKIGLFLLLPALYALLDRDFKVKSLFIP